MSVAIFTGAGGLVGAEAMRFLAGKSLDVVGIAAGAVFNMGGGRAANCSVLEAFALTKALTGRPMRRGYQPESRAGDHTWWISDTRRFQAHCPGWRLTRGIPDMIQEIHDEAASRAEAA